jgi:glyoxylate reductase
MSDTAEAMRILMTQLVPQPAIDLIRREMGPDGVLDINPEPDTIWTQDELLDRLRAGNYNALYCMLTNRIDSAVMDAAPDLRVIANFAVGYNNVDVPEATRRRIPVTNTPGVLTDTTADFAFALLMAVARRVVEADKFARAGRFHGWGPLMMVGTDIHGKTLGIVGFGRIGRGVARRANGFGMRVLYHDRVPADSDTEATLNATSVSLEDLLAGSDYVSLHTDYNPETHHLIGSPELSSMKAGAYLINTARGAIVDEAALVEALKSGHLAGAALDVFEREPEIHPELLKLDNVVLAPHIASASVETRTAMAVMAAENVLSALRGERPPNVANPELYEYS